MHSCTLLVCPLRSRVVCECSPTKTTRRCRDVVLVRTEQVYPHIHAQRFFGSPQFTFAYIYLHTHTHMFAYAHWEPPEFRELNIFPVLTGGEGIVYTII